MLYNKYSLFKILACLICLHLTTGCKKYLDEKPDPKQVEPSTLGDLQALLDNYQTVNISGPSLLVVVADEYFLTSSTYASRNVDVQNNYIWDANATELNSWQYAYQSVYYTNLVLDRLQNLSVSGATDMATYNDIQGQALFFRAFIFWHLAQLYCKPYAPENATAPGIALRLQPDITVKSSRATVQQTYDQIINDLKASADLLPDKSIGITRPTKAAAYGALARTYLSMRDYPNAGKYANLSLQKSGGLIDYNTVSAASANPFDPYSTVNPEDILFAQLPGNGVPTTTSLLDTTLYASFEADDLRKTVAITTGNGGYILKGSYAGGASAFNGIATDEMYLIRSESSARNGSKDSALADLNRLLIKRYKAGKYNILTTANTPDVLGRILLERKKELIFRGIRWSDIRRLNLEGANITLTRIVNGSTYTLPPNDLRSVMLIPREVISQTNLEQNPR